MAKNKKGFLLYANYIDVFSTLSNEESGILIKHIFDYVNDKNPPELKDRVLSVSFSMIKNQLKADLTRWEGVISKRSEAGKIGGIKSGEARRKQKEAIASFDSSTKQTKQTEANEADIDIDIDTVNDIDISIGGSEKTSPPRGRFIPPSVGEVEGYLKEIGVHNFSEVAIQFVSFYDSKDWMVGKNKMKKWRSAVSGWVSRNKLSSSNGSQSDAAQKSKYWFI